MADGGPIDLGARLAAHAANDGDALLSEDRRIGFSELLDHAQRIMGIVLAHGWEPGQAVGIAIGDEPLHLAAALALLAIGAPQVGLSAHETPESNALIMQRLGVALTLCDGPREWLADTKTVEISPETLRRAPGGSGVSRPSAAESPAVYVRTSGSTSVPKLFALSYARLVDGAARCAADPASACVMRSGSMEFDATRVFRLFAALAGRPSAISPRDMDEVGAVCGRLGVSQLQIGVYRLSSLMRSGRQLGRLPEGTSLMTGGSRAPGPLRADIAARLTRELFVSYATSEIGPISIATPDEHEAFPEGVGRPRPDALVEIVDDDGNLLQRGETGEIRVRRPAAPKTYIGEPSSQFRDGWFYPRDFVSWPENGPLIHHGRADDVMLLNGLKISGAAIEDALNAHPGVMEAVAYPIRSRLHGEVPAAAVTLTASIAAPPDAAALIDHCRTLLGVRSPRKIVVLDEIPRTPTGKPLRRVLAEL